MQPECMAGRNGHATLGRAMADEALRDLKPCFSKLYDGPALEDFESSPPKDVVQRVKISSVKLPEPPQGLSIPFLGLAAKFLQKF